MKKSKNRCVISNKIISNKPAVLCENAKFYLQKEGYRVIKIKNIDFLIERLEDDD